MKEYLCSVKDQIHMLLLRRVAVLKLLPREELDQWHHRLSHVDDAPLLLIDVGGVNNDPLQAVKGQRLWEKELAKTTEQGHGGITRDIVPFSIRSIRRWGVPTAIPVRCFWRKETCSSTLKCLANCRTTAISNLPLFFPSHRYRNLPTWQLSSSLIQTSSKLWQSSVSTIIPRKEPNSRHKNIPDQIRSTQTRARHDQRVRRPVLLGRLSQLGRILRELFQELWQVVLVPGLLEGSSVLDGVACASTCQHYSLFLPSHSSLPFSFLPFKDLHSPEM